MRSKKSIIAILTILMLLVVFSGSAMAVGGSWSSSSSNPGMVSVYYTNTWSPPAYWDLRNYSGLPNNAVVTGIMMNWSTTPTYGYTGFQSYLYKTDGTGYQMQSGVMDHRFDGISAKQNWSTKFKVATFSSPPGFVNYVPQLTIFYDAS